MPVWRNPAAWFGLAALAIPIAVHFLARARARVIAFPSLRFIDISRLAARKRRTLSDLPLLALRLLALSLAIAAFADPLFLTAARRKAWGARVSRAVVIDTSASMTRGQAAREATRAAGKESHEAGLAGGPHADASVCATTTIRAESLQNGVARAVAWLRTSPPSRREVAVISDFQLGTIDAELLRDVPDDMGLRFIRVGTPTRELDVDTSAVSTRVPGRNDFQWRRAQLHVGENTTSVASRIPVALPPIAITLSDTGLEVTPFGMRVSVAQAQRAVALATLQAVLAEGVPAPAKGRARPLRAVELALAPESSPSGNGAAGAARTPTARRPGTAAPPPNTAPPQPSTSEVAPISAPWMSEALNRIASDLALGHAIRAADAADAADAANAADAAAVAATPWRVVLSDMRGVPVLLAATRTSHRAREPDARDRNAPERNARERSVPERDARDARGRDARDAPGRDARELVLLARLSASAPATPLLFRAVLGALAGPDGLAEAEVRTIPDTTLASWTRPPAEPSAEALRHVEDSDRQWLWAGVLAVLLVETWMRRDRPQARSGPKSVETHEHAA